MPLPNNNIYFHLSFPNLPSHCPSLQGLDVAVRLRRWNALPRTVGWIQTSMVTKLALGSLVCPVILANDFHLSDLISMNKLTISYLSHMLCPCSKQHTNCMQCYMCHSTVFVASPSKVPTGNNEEHRLLEINQNTTLKFHSLFNFTNTKFFQK